MNQKAEELKKRTRRFLEVIALVKTFPMTVDADIIGKQLIRAAAGVAGQSPAPGPDGPRRLEQLHQSADCAAIHRKVPSVGRCGAAQGRLLPGLWSADRGHAALGRPGSGTVSATST